MRPLMMIVLCCTLSWVAPSWCQEAVTATDTAAPAVATDTSNEGHAMRVWRNVVTLMGDSWRGVGLFMLRVACRAVAWGFGMMVLGAVAPF